MVKETVGLAIKTGDDSSSDDNFDPKEAEKLQLGDYTSSDDN